MKLLVHACCAPCSIMPLRLLGEAGHDITIYYSNSNIAPEAEYWRRLQELRDYSRSLGLPLVEADYSPDTWEERVAPVGEALKDYSPAFGAAAGEQAEGSVIESVAQLLNDERRCERCRLCYRLRLGEAADFAQAEGFEAIATTLAVSPYQFGEVIHDELHAAAEPRNLSVNFADYRPYYREGTVISRELGMYRQNYCGCRFSIAEAEATRAFLKSQRKNRCSFGA